MNRPTIRVDFIDDYLPNLNKTNNLIYNIISKKYSIQIDTKDPDIVFCSSFGWSRLQYKSSLIVFHTSENDFPDFNVCDYALSPMRESIGGRNFYHPYYARIRFAAKPFPEDPIHRQFASFIASSSGPYGSKYRIDFVRYLMDHYMRVDCPGKALHNVDIAELSARRNKDWHVSKCNVISRYKFSVAFENSNTDGYITEKLTDAFMANTIPIYWGSEGNVEPFPREAMICANDFPDFDSLLKRVRDVNENDDLYLSMLKANPMHNKEFMDNHQKYLQAREKFLYKICDEALIRQTTRGAHYRRPIGNLSDIVEYVIDKEASRISKSVSQNMPFDVDKIEKDLLSVNKKIDSLRSEIVCIREAQDNCINLKDVQEEQSKNIKWLIEATRLPYYKKAYFLVRILSHLLPTYRGGVYIKRKRALRERIRIIERHFKD